MTESGAAFAPLAVPAQPNSLIGRSAELDAICRRFVEGTTRLVTLTGPAGTGKTRLALAAAEALIPAGRDGVTLVDLSPLGDWRLVAPAIARSMAIRKQGNRSHLDVVKNALRRRPVLLILDNFEQVMGAAPQIADLLAACIDLKVLVTSREPLRISWEYALPVAPLTLPEATATSDPARVAQAPAVELFLQRAVAVQPEFTLTAENCAAVAEICARLDGLPLAIELAAARTDVLPPEAMVARLDRRLELLKGGAADRPARHRALRAAIDWSYALLDPPGQSLFRRLGVLAGGGSLDAAAAAGDLTTGPETTLDAVAALCNKSLLYREKHNPREPRFRMLETMREFALEQLAAAGEVEQTAHRVCHYFLALAQRSERSLQGPEQHAIAERLDLDHDNLRVSLRWLAGHGEPVTALKMAASLAAFWSARGYLNEGILWLSSLLALPENASPTEERARALIATAGLLRLRGDDEQARSLIQEANEIAKLLAAKQLVEPSSMAAGADDAPAGNRAEAHRGGVLSAREMDVLRLIARGLTNREIARELVVSIPTVQTHLTNIYGKLDIHSRAAATAYFFTQRPNT